MPSPAKKRPRPSRPAPAVLPKGPHRLSRAEVATSQRDRLLQAVSTVVAERGYPSATVREIASTGRVSYATFYEHFRDKEECFFAAYDEVVVALIATVEEAITAASSPLEALRDGLRRYLEWFAEHPDAAVTYLIEIRTAGPKALDRRAAALERFEGVFRSHLESFRAGDNTLPDIRPAAIAALATSIDGLAYEEVRLGRTAGLGLQLPTALYIALILLVGHEAANAFSLPPSPKPAASSRKTRSRRKTS